MRKTLALVIMTVFILSIVPAALAQTDTRERGKDAAQKRIAQERMNNARQDARKDLTEKRDVRQQVRTAVKERVAEHKQAFADFRTQLKDCRGQRTAACEAARKDVRNQAKLYLKDTIEDVLENLKKLREQAATTSTEDTSATQEINSVITDVETTQQTVDALSDDATADQVKDATKKVAQAVKKARHAVKVQNARHANAGLHGVIIRAEKLEKKLEKTLERLKAKGADTSTADAKVATFKDEIKLARENADKAKAKFEAARTDKENFESLVREGHAFLAEARTHLRNAHQTLKEAVRAIKNLKEGTETLNDAVAAPDTTTSTPTTESAPTAPAPPSLPTGVVVAPISEVEIIEGGA